MKSKIDLSQAFDHEDPAEGQKLFEKIMTPELHHHLARNVSDHLLGKMPKETGVAFDNPNQGSGLRTDAKSPRMHPKHVKDKTVSPQHLEGDSWRSSPQAQSGSSTETGEDAGLP